VPFLRFKEKNMTILIFTILTIAVALLLTYSLVHTVAPANQLEQELDDRDQIDYLKKMAKKP